LIVKEIFDGETRRGWAVDGSPADCVKLAVSVICPERPQLVVSGINGGQNAGINVLYSGTVAAAIEGAFFGITSIAVSLEYDEHAQFERAAYLARNVIQQILSKKGPESQLFNLNIPTAALKHPKDIRIVPMSVTPWIEEYEERIGPNGRPYYWASGEFEIPDDENETDLAALAEGHVTLTALDFDLTKRAMLDEMRTWKLSLDDLEIYSPTE
ncbi:MAG: 5'/3'-nucleotidase SurE, partial [Pirellulales bacterium]|nr:5'/3'-nucleotidase SurE [Pirellulales bacterium]